MKDDLAFKRKRDAVEHLNKVLIGWPAARVISRLCDVPTRRKVRYFIDLNGNDDYSNILKE